MKYLTLIVAWVQRWLWPRELHCSQCRAARPETASPRNYGACPVAIDGLHQWYEPAWIVIPPHQTVTITMSFTFLDPRP